MRYAILVVVALLALAVLLAGFTWDEARAAGSIIVA